MKKKLIIIPAAAFCILLVNAFFGHLIFDLKLEQEINKYSTYIHLQPGWDSSPKNILFDITTVWSNSQLEENDPFYNPEIDIDKLNYNEVLSQHGKEYVQLKHEFSDCKKNWKPILYKLAVDSIQSRIDNFQGLQVNSDPYVKIYPNISSKNNLDSKTKLQSGFSQFIPICTSKQITSYDFSIKVNDDDIGFDVYFVPTIDEQTNFANNVEFNYYDKKGCFAQNQNSFSGSCDDIENTSGLLVIIPDELNLSLTKISVNLHEKL